MAQQTATRLKHLDRGLSQREEEIINAVYTYRYLSVEQVTRLFFSPTSRNYAGEYLRKLTVEKYITRFPLPAARPGNPQLIYTLSLKGIRFLGSTGVAMHGITRPPQEPSFQHISHSLAVNDFLIGATTLTKQFPAVSLVRFHPEWILKHTPLKTPDFHVIPDGWLDFRLPVQGERVQFPLWLELDRGSEDQAQLRRKVHNLIQAVLSPSYASRFGTSLVTIAFAVTTGAKRVHTVVSWIEKELADMQLTQEADLFLVGDISACRLTPARLFFDPFWVCPLRAGQYSLLPQ